MSDAMKVPKGKKEGLAVGGGLKRRAGGGGGGVEVGRGADAGRQSFHSGEEGEGGRGWSGFGWVFGQDFFTSMFF